ncbi:MAG: glutaredoxin family protein [Ignavibacteria bacterium]|nr:glutaredoxin family protein [Ignavibacteria bacterium]
MTELILYTKSGCHLCDVMEETVLKFKNEFDFDFRITDIERDDELNKMYKEKIPVLLVNGKMFSKYAVDESKLRKKLQACKLV